MSREAVRPKHPVLEEAMIAACALGLLAALIAVVFWRATGVSPWPGVIVAEAIAVTWGLILVILTSPSRGR